MKKFLVYLFCCCFLPAMMISVNATEQIIQEDNLSVQVQEFQDECLAPENVYPFVFNDAIAADTWERRIGEHDCEDGYLYVKNKETGIINQILLDKVKEIQETQTYIYCVTESNNIVRTDYSGESVQLLYSARCGVVSEMKYRSGALYFVDGGKLVRFDLSTNTFAEMMDSNGIVSMYPYEADKLMLLFEDGVFYTFDVQTRTLSLLGDQFAANQLLSTPAEVTSLASFYSTFAIPSNAQTVTLPLAEYPVGSYFSTGGVPCGCHSNSYNPCPDVKGCICISYANSIQCMAFAKYACDQYAHLTYLNTTGNWLDERNACADRRTYKYSDELVDASDVREEFESLGVGSYVRLKWLDSENGHSFVIVEFLENGVITYDCNVAGDCDISLQTRSYASLTSYDYILNTVTHHFEGIKTYYSATHHSVKCINCAGYAHKTHYTTNAAGRTCDGCGYVGTIPVISP